MRLPALGRKGLRWPRTRDLARLSAPPASHQTHGIFTTNVEVISSPVEKPHCSVELWLRTRRPRVTTMPSRRTGWLCVAAEGTKCCPRSDLSEIVQGARKADKDAVNHLTEGEHCVSVFFCRTERIKGYQRHSVHSLLVVFRYLDLDKVVI